MFNSYLLEHFNTVFIGSLNIRHKLRHYIVFYIVCLLFVQNNVGLYFCPPKTFVDPNICHLRKFASLGTTNDFQLGAVIRIKNMKFFLMDAPSLSCILEAHQSANFLLTFTEVYFIPLYPKQKKLKQKQSSQSPYQIVSTFGFISRQACKIIHFKQV